MAKAPSRKSAHASRSARPSKATGPRKAGSQHQAGRHAKHNASSRRTDASRTPSNARARSSALDLIEGRRACAEAFSLGMPLKRLLVAEGEAEHDRSVAELIRQAEERGIAVTRVSRLWLNERSSHGAHQGIAAEVAPFRYATLDELIQRVGEGSALVLVLDHVTDQGNLGAIVRSAEVVGAAGVVIAKARAAGVGVGAYKTSAGAVMHLPIVQVSNLATAVEKLQAAGFWAAAATEHAEQDVWNAPMGGRLCLVMGSEGSGVSRLVRERCDFTCKLPQRGKIESLNVAQAATVLCYEWLRREHEAGQ